MAELLLPGFFVDQVELDATTDALILANRDPEPNETEVPLASDVTFDVISLAPEAVDLASLNVTIDSTPAVIAGVVQAGYALATSNPEPNTLRVTVNPDTDFTPDVTVSVNVVASTVGATQSLNETYTFNTVDTIAPTVTSAQAIALDKVRVSFSEDIDTTTSVVAANYVIEGVDTPTYEPTVTSVTQNSSSSVELTLSQELSQLKLYKVVVTNVEDEAGNVVVAPDNDAEFTSLSYGAPAGRLWDLYRMLPRKNRDEDITQDLFNFISCLQELTDLKLLDIDKFTEIFDPLRADENWLDLLLLDLGNPFPFAFTLPVIEKRKLLDVLISVYKQKGTKVGIQNVIKFFLGIEVDVTTFNVDIARLGEAELGFDFILGSSAAFNLYAFEVRSPVGITDEQREQIEFIAEYMKPAHTHLVRVTEPEDPDDTEFLELGVSELGVNWVLN